MGRNSLRFDEISHGGFFKVYFNKLLRALEEDTMEEFEALESDEERMRFFSEVIIPDNELEIEWLDTGKNKGEANRLKTEGNKAFGKGNNKEALRLYTESLLKVPQDGDSTRDLAIILANRSACLYHMEEYESARGDIDRALALDYPNDLRYKIRDRKARCFLAEQRHQDAIVEFKNTLRALDDSELATERKLKIQRDIQVMLEIMTRPKTKDGRLNALLPRRPVTKTSHPEPKLCSKRHKIYSCACDKLEILQEEKVGRFASAAEDVNPGDVVLIEKPYCSVLLQELSRNHCIHCFSRTLTPYPCKKCSTVVFCSEDCKKEGESYHRYECPVLETVYASGASVTVLMALRIITLSPLGFFLEKKSSLSEERRETEEYRSSDYETLYRLVRHEKQRKREDFLERTVMAWFLLRCLKKGGYFSQDTEGGPNRAGEGDEHFIGSLILRHLQILQFNAHEVFHVELKRGEKLEEARSVFIGGGIFPTLSLFNHSCDPGVVRYFRGKTVVVRAIKAIRKGSVIAENYGPIFTTTGREERKRKLRNQFWFDCECTPCIENWPGFAEMDGTVFRFRCDSRLDDGKKSNACESVILVPQTTNEFMVKCSTCGEYTNILKGLKILQDTDIMYRQATRDAEAGNYEAAIGIYLEILSMLEGVMAPPFKDYHLCQQAIRTCMLCQGSKTIK